MQEMVRLTDRCRSGDMLADKQTDRQTDRQTSMLIAIFRSLSDLVVDSSRVNLVREGRDQEVMGLTDRCLSTDESLCSSHPCLVREHRPCSRLLRPHYPC